MLKKSIWFFLHMLGTVVLAVALLIGVFLWNQYSYSWEVIQDSGQYEYSEALLNELRYESGIIWNYFNAKQIVAEYEYEEESLTVDALIRMLDEIGLTEEDLSILAEKYGLTGEGVQAFLEEQKDDILSKEVVDSYKLDVVYSDVPASDTYAEAQSLCMLGDDRYDSEYTNLRYTISFEGEYIDSNLPVESEDNQSRVYEETRDDGYVLHVYLNADYPADDYYFNAAVIYNRIQNWKWFYFGSIFVSLVFIVMSLIRLTRLAGQVKGKDGIRLSWVDKPPLELTLLFWVAIAVAVYIIMLITAKSFYDDSNYFWLIIFGLTVLIGDNLALIGYLSLVRRIKSRTLGRNSICYKTGEAIVRIIRNLLSMAKVSQKILIACGSYIIIMLLLSMIGGRVSMVFAVIISIIGLLIVYRDAVARQEILDGMEKITSGELDYQIDLDRVNHLQMEVAKSANQVGSAMQKAVNQSLKDERLKADLITNVSHDIKTPLTSIINYVDLLKREEIQNENASAYLEILDQKSQRLKQLTEDLVEASKLSSGNVVLNMEKIDFNEILQQSLGEFEEKFESKELVVVLKRPDTRVMVMGEGRRIWRILENLFQNVYKYAMPGTRVYVELQKDISEMIFTLKNISRYPLNINADELTERFIRGDISRTTEGSGLGLSIARDLTTLQQGGFDIHLDGDLFKVTLKFELIE